MESPRTLTDTRRYLWITTIETVTMAKSDKLYSERELVKIKDSFTKFKGRPFREHQLEAISFALETKKPVVVVEAPTGAGKSLIGAVAAKASGMSAYLVHSKSLQSQIEKDFEEFFVLFGRGNYQCLEIKGATCAECMYRNPSDDCSNYGRCEYAVNKQVALMSKLCTLNYSYFMTEANFVGKFAGRDMVVCDEADTLENELLNFINLTVRENQLKEFNLGFPEFRTATARNGVASWKAWAVAAKKKVAKAIVALPQDAKKRDEERLAGLVSKLTTFADIVDDTWIFQEGKNTAGTYLSFSPIWITPDMTDRYLRKHVGSEANPGKILLMSATLPPAAVLSACIGVPLAEMALHEVPSVFPPESRPIHINPVAKMSAKTFDEEFPKLAKEIIRICDDHKDEKGLIHTNSYRLATMIMEECNRSGRMVTHNGKDKIEQIEAFKKSDRPLVMVSPSMDRGVSLDGDLCRFTIVAKAPFPDLSNKQTSARLYGGGEVGRFWYRAMTAQTIEQCVGRGMRSADDRCECYMLDTYIAEMISSQRQLFSKYFRECITW